MKSTPPGRAIGWTLPVVLGPGGFAIEQLEAPNGMILGVTPAADGRGLIVPELGRWLTQPDATTWLEYQAPGRFRLLIEPGSAAGDGRRADHRARDPR